MAAAHVFRTAVRPAMVFCLAAYFAACGQPSTENNPNAPTGYNVVLVTFDGVRWQELVSGSDPLFTDAPVSLFPLFRDKIAPRGTLYGDPRAGSAMTVATAANASLPGYASIYAEEPQGCLTNACGRIAVPTFVDRIKDELELPQAALAVFAAWPRLKLAVSSRDDVAVVHAADYDSSLEPSHEERDLLDDSMEFDRGVVLSGFQYLREKPRFLHLSFLDSDRYGHQGNYAAYARVLSTYDRLLGELVDRLDASGDYGRNTALIITTDHGRGQVDQWGEHGPHVPASARVWAFVMAPAAASDLKFVSPTARGFDHHDVRYTIETVFGLGTKRSAGVNAGFLRRVMP